MEFIRENGNNTKQPYQRPILPYQIPHSSLPYNAVTASCTNGIFIELANSIDRTWMADDAIIIVSPITPGP